MKKVFLFCCLLSLYSCAVHSGLTNNSNSHNTTVQLSQANYKVISFISGKSTVEYFLGIGGIDQPAQIQAARIAMLKNVDLIGKPRALINETVEIKRSTFLLWTEVEVTVSAHVIEFVSDQIVSDVNVFENNSQVGLTTSKENIAKSTDETKKSNELNLINDKKNQLDFLNAKMRNKQINSTPYSKVLIPAIGDFVLFHTYETGPMIGQIYDISCEKKMCPCKVEVVSENGELIILNLRFLDLIELVQTGN